MIKTNAKAMKANSSPIIAHGSCVMCVVTDIDGNQSTQSMVLTNQDRADRLMSTSSLYPKFLGKRIGDKIEHLGEVYKITDVIADYLD